VEVTWGLNAS